ncbi:hypothetical protein M0805_004025 [Coniferiporia weirii]|nr:hypothetical protein M0805_004025 [Coniferiporia weirii]
MHPYGGIPICPRCETAVYAAEQIMGPGRNVCTYQIYNPQTKLILALLPQALPQACTTCGKRLDSLSLMEHDKEPYCKQCYNKNFGPRDLRQANLPHRDDIPIPLSSSPVRPTYTGSPAKSYRSMSPTQEEKEVEGRFERAKRGQPDRVGSPHFQVNALAKRTEGFKQGSKSSGGSVASASDRSASPLRDELGDNGQSESESGREGKHDVEKNKVERSTPGIPRTIPLTSALSGRGYGPITPNARAPTQFIGPSTSVPRSKTPSLPAEASASPQSSPERHTAAGTRYGAALLGSPKAAGSSPWASRAMPGTGTPLCARCTKPVYFAEQVKANGRTFHKPCLRCTDCNTALDSSRLVEKGDKIVCRSCYSKHYGPQGSGYALLGKAGG